MADIVLAGIIMGVLGTVAIDVWALVLHRLAGQPLPNWGMPGRWLAHVPRGVVFHSSIADAEPIHREVLIGWAFHYAVGITYGIALAIIMGPEWLASPTFLPALIFSTVMVGFGWFLLQPGMGLGWAASKAPKPWTVRFLNLAAHTVFALGLWVGALL